MNKTKLLYMNKTIQANGYDISIFSDKGLGDFVSLTDIAKFKTQENSGYVIQNWMRNRNTIRFLALWEKMQKSVPAPNCGLMFRFTTMCRSVQTV